MHFSPGAVLEDGAAGAVCRRSFGQRALVAAQVAAALVLLASAAIVYNTIRRVLAVDLGFDARAPMYTNIVTAEIDEQLYPQRVASAWIGVFGVIALLLAAIGLYGVVAQGVLLRTRPSSPGPASVQ